ncbi:MAG TPA: bifunctional aspartate kinase/homoserine dehydrogenase I [bacterium]|nr:bifunctional aspartate kinase/homoserine dehydrogenase I [bacterium]
MLVHKFGGTSVKNAERITVAAQLIAQHDRPAVVVTSALAGVTDTLIVMAEAAKERKNTVVETNLAALRARHLDTATVVVSAGDTQTALLDFCRQTIDELEQLLHGVFLLRELTPRSQALIASFGERLAAPILAAAISQQGLRGRVVDARDIIRTDDNFLSANVDMTVSRELTRKTVLPMADKAVCVITGFIGKTESGLTTTLGRGGSDFSASLIGAFLDADEIWIWTDVDGVMTADPRIVPEARVLEAISYREAAEMAYFGSRVLHPRTMIPAVQQNIPLRIRNSFSPEHPGTLITDRRTDRFQGVKSVTSIPDMAMVTLEGKGMIGVPGIVQRVFTATARAGVNVFMISQASSEQNISFIVRQGDGARVVKELEEEFKLELFRKMIERIDLAAPVGILAIIGEGMKGTPGISQRLFTALGRGRINVLAIAQGSSELNVSVVVDQDNLQRAVAAVHTRFGLTTDTHVVLFGKGLIGRTLISQLLAGQERLRRDHGLSLKVIGVCGRDELLFDPAGIKAEALRQIADGATLRSLGGETRPADKEIIERIVSTQRMDVVLVDVTAAETIPLHALALQNGIHVVTANKKPLSGSLADYKNLRWQAFAHGAGYHFETTFGAGLPVLFTLQDLLATHDRILRVTGCFSGTLGYICSGLQEGRLFSEVVREAKALGFTEPDPRDDLSGLDVARKALIIAREIGLELEMTDVDLTGMVPSEMMALPDVDTFMNRLPDLDDDFAAQVEQARTENKVLRYLVEIVDGRVTVGLKAVELQSAEGQLNGPDNIVVYQTERYRNNPLIIRGPGAGAEVTAAGVFGDLLKVARHA